MPVARANGDIAHSHLSDPAQARHVFLGGNDLPGRWQGQHRFVILDTGFGLGLNFLTTWHAWRTDPARCQRLHFVAFEKHPFTAADLARAQAHWPEFAELAAQLQARWPHPTPGMHRLHLDAGRVILTLIFGETAQRLRTVDLAADAFFLTGVSPAQNPTPGSPERCRALARLAAPGATLAIPSEAGQHHTALNEAEFDLEKRPGFAGQGDILTGRFRSRRPNRHPLPSSRQAIILGAGIAGSTTAHALARAGWQVTVFDAASDAGMAASGNLAGVLRPLPSADDNRLSRLTRAGYLATRALLTDLPSARWSPCGVLHLGREPVHEAQQRRAVEQLGWPADVLQFIDAAAASARLGWPVDTGGWWFPEGGWVQPPSLCRTALAAYPGDIDFRASTTVDRLTQGDFGWQVQDANGHVLAEAPTLIIAAGAAATRLGQLAWLPQKSARGQVSHLPAGSTPALPHVVCKLGYAAPLVDGFGLIGATLQARDDDTALRLADHQENLARLNLSLPGFACEVDPDTLGGKVGFRPMSPDRLPILGAVPAQTAVSAKHRLPNLPRLPGLWCAQGYGARGIVWSALMADLLLSRLEGDPLPLETDLVDAVDPGRFLLGRSTPPGAGDDV